MDQRYSKKKEEKVIYAYTNCLSVKDQCELVEKACKLPSIQDRITLLEDSIGKVNPGSRPYFQFLINKFTSKLKGCWTTSYNANKCQVNCLINHNQKDCNGISDAW